MTKRARSDTALGATGGSRPRPRPAYRGVEVVLPARRAPATFDPVRDLQNLRNEINTSISTLIGAWEAKARSNVPQGKGKGRAP